MQSIVGKMYVYVCVDDFSKLTWTNFLRKKLEAFKAFEELWIGLSKEFDNSFFRSLCGKNDIGHEFSAPKTPQRNEVVERKNKTLQEMTRVMLKSKNVLTKFWAEVVNTKSYILNQAYLRLGTPKTSYEIRKGKKPNLIYLHEFGSVRDLHNMHHG